MVDEPGPSGIGFTLFVTGYRLYQICHSTSDGYFPLNSVYATREEARTKVNNSEQKGEGIGAFQEYRVMMRLSPADKRAINKRNWKTTNERRLTLIDQESGWGLTSAEAIELERLQRLAGVHRGRRMWADWKALDKLDAVLFTIKE
ncbi:MAG: hypothetical protein WA082_03920 [Candidatus Moraniibacteriota bacterium]